MQLPLWGRWALTARVRSVWWWSLGVSFYSRTAGDTARHLMPRSRMLQCELHFGVVSLGIKRRFVTRVESYDV